MATKRRKRSPQPSTKASQAPTKRRYGFNSGMLFLGCMFLGLGVGQLLGAGGAGILIGMGAGFLAMHYARE